MWPRSEDEREALKLDGVTDEDLAKVYTADDLAQGERILFAATGISDSTLLKGIRYEGTHAITTSILMRARYHTVRYVKTCHDLDLKTIRLRSDGTDHAV
jgi:fructose-1,6-bisphosphatase II